ATNVTSQFTVALTGFRFRSTTGRFLQSATITKNSGAPLGGPFAIAFDGLSSNASLFNPAGTTNCAVPLGSPFLILNPGTTWTNGQSVTVNMEFVNPTNGPITYSPRILAGSSNN